MIRLAFRCVLLLTLLASLARANQDRYVPLSEIRLTSPDIGQSGPILFLATIDNNKWSSIHIEAFGQKYDLTKDQLASLLPCSPENKIVLVYGDFPDSTVLPLYVAANISMSKWENGTEKIESTDIVATKTGKLEIIKGNSEGHPAAK